jgi:hypothetical protein
VRADVVGAEVHERNAGGDGVLKAGAQRNLGLQQRQPRCRSRDATVSSRERRMGRNIPIKAGQSSSILTNSSGETTRPGNHPGCPSDSEREAPRSISTLSHHARQYRTPSSKEARMRELTIHELDVQLAEQLPARELMDRARLGRLTNLIHIIAATSVTQGSTAIAADHSILIGSGNTFVISLQIVL